MNHHTFIITQGAMKKIVIKHSPAFRLPEELRVGIREDALVTVTIEWEEASQRPSSAPGDDGEHPNDEHNLSRP